MPSEMLGGLVLIWLLVLSWFDYRTRELPHWASTMPLLLVGLGRVGYPPTDARSLIASSAVFLALMAIVMSDIRPLQITFSVVALVLAFQTHTPVLVLVGTWIGALLWAQWGFWGEGDAKVVMILSAIWPDIYLVGMLLLALLLGGLGALWRRYGIDTVAVLGRVQAKLLRGHVPARQEQEEAASWTYQAGVPWMTLGTAVYLAGNLWLF